MTTQALLTAIVAAWDSSRAEPADVRLDSMFDVIEPARQFLADLASPAFQKGMKDGQAGVEFGRSMGKPDDLYRKGFAFARDEPTTPEPKATDAVVKITDDLRNVSFIRHTKGRGWACTLANGTPASLFYAGIPSDEETGTVVALERAKTPADVLRVVSNRVRSSRYIVELV